jgi:hypothetical protein
VRTETEKSPLLEAVTRKWLAKTVTDQENLMRKQERTNLFNYNDTKISKKW